MKMTRHHKHLLQARAFYKRTEDRLAGGKVMTGIQCPRCGSNKVVTEGPNLRCQECGALFDYWKNKGLKGE